MRFVVVVNVTFAILVSRHNCLGFPTSAALCRSTRCRAFSIGTLCGEVSRQESIWGEEYTDDARIAARLVSDATKLCQVYERRMQKVENTTQNSSTQTTALQKKDGTPVTALDFAIQGYILSSLTQHEHQQDGNRSFSFLGEEDAEDLRGTRIASMALDLIHHINSDMTMKEFLDALDVHKREGEHKNGHRSWILDPIDGTKGLLYGKQYCIGLALSVDGKPTVGVLGNPSVQDATARIMIAIKDHGLRYYNPRSDEFQDRPRTIPNAWHTKDYDKQQWEDSALAQLSKSTRSDSPKQARIDCPPYLLSLGPKTNENQRESEPKLPRPFGPLCHPNEICCGSLVKYFAVASGQVSSFVQLAPSGWVKTWDHAPGILCVQESGGSVVLVDSKENVSSLGYCEDTGAESNKKPSPLLDRKEFFIHDGIVAFAKEAKADIRKQIIDSI